MKHFNLRKNSIQHVGVTLKKFNILFLLLTSMLISSLANAQTPMYYKGGGTGGNSFPFAGSASSGSRVQLLYTNTSFQAAPISGLINTVYFRPSGSSTGTFTTLSISMMNTTLTTLTSGAWNSGMTNVFSGNITLTAVAGNWMAITLQTPFQYDATKNLIIDVSQVAQSGGFAVYTGSYSGGNARMYGTQSSTTSTGADASFYDFGFDLLPKKGMNNASVASIASPTTAFCSGVTLPVSVNIKNYGYNRINNVTINWLLDGLPQPPINWTTMIDTVGSVAGNTAVVNLGNIFFGATPRTFKVYTSMPNGVIDTVTNNDTLYFTLGASLNGIYTIGGTTPDFPNVVAAAAALNARGVCGPVTFKIRAGTYSGAVVLNTINGASAVNRVTFQPDDNVPASAVNVNYASTGIGDRSVISFSGASYLTFKNLTINSTGTAGYGNCFYFNTGSVNDSITGCTLNTTSSTSTNYACISSVTSGNNYNNMVITNNTMTGSVGIYYLYGNTAAPTTGFVLENNTISAFYIGVYYLYYVNGPVIRNNTITGTGGASSYMGMYYIYCNGAIPCDITRNSIKGFYAYGLMVYYPSGTSTNRGKIMNNVVISNPSTTSNYGMMIYYPTYVDIANNTSVIVGTTYASGYAGYLLLSGYTGGRVYNNLFANYATGFAMYANFSAGGSQVSDYNNLYTNGSVLYYDATNAVNYANIDLWRNSAFAKTTLGGLDKNSISYTPGINTSTGMPDPSMAETWSLNGRGMQMAGNDKDILGNARPVTLAAGVPDIGAFEFEPQSVPPDAIASPPVGIPGAKQYYTFGYDTVAVITWNPTLGITTPLTVKQYSGRQAPGFNAVSPNRFMYFYTDIKATGSGNTYDFSPDIYYMDPWLGTMGAEANIKLAHKFGNYPWVAYSGATSSANISRNFLAGSGLTSFGSFTGIDTNILSAIVKPKGSTIICNGSYVILKANTATGYSYQWNLNGLAIGGATADSFMATAPGDYSVTVTSGSNAATSIPVTVAVVPSPMSLVSASGPLTYCTGSSLQLAATTGPGLTYQWQVNGNNINGATNPTYSVAGPGTYTVIVRNIGCGTVSPAAVVTPGPLQVNLGSDTTFCEVKNQPFTINAGYTGAKFAWSTGDTSQSIQIYKGSGSYSVVVDAGPNCVARDTINVVVKPLPNIIGINYVSAGYSYTFNTAGAQNAASYLWIFGDGTTSTQQQVSKTFPDGNVIVRLVAFNECGSDTSAMIAWATNVGNTTLEGYNVSLYPNPANDKVTVSLEGNVYLKDVVVLNALGQVVHKQAVEGNAKSVQLDVAKYVSGHYMLRAVTTEGTVSKPFNIER